MLKRMKYLILSLLAFSLFSCADLNKGKQLKAIVTMQTSLDSIQKVLLKNEIDTIAAFGVATNTVELRIKNHYYADTIDMALGKKMDAYKKMRRTIGPLGKSFNTIKTGVIAEKETLKKLQSDIENGYGERQKFPEYIEFEKAKVEQLRILLKEYVDQKIKTMAVFHELHDELDAFSRSLVEKDKNQRKRKS